MSKKRPPLNDANSNTGLVGLGPIPSQAPVASHNILQIESLLRTKGFLCYHYKHTYNPDQETLAGPVDPTTQGAFRGLIYYDPRPLYHIPQGFKMDDLLTAQAVYGQGSVMFNLSGDYYDAEERPQQEFNPLDKRVHVRPRDLIVFPSLTDMVAQKFEFNPTGPQKLHYRAKGIDHLRSKSTVFVCGMDYDLSDDGQIIWLEGGRKPGFKSGKGEILSVVYYYTPIYIAWQPLHYLRVIPSNDFGQGGITRNAVYAPQQYVFKPSTIIEEENLLDWCNLPPLPEYADSKNTTGGST